MHFKKATQLFIIFLIFMFSFSSIVYANQVIILVDQLNVREGPGTDYELVDSVHSDEQYNIIQQQDDWIEIQLEHTTGWVSAEYVSLEDQSEQVEDMNTSITIPVDHVQVRSGPSTDDEILFFAKQGTNFDVLSESNEWYEVENADDAGYIHKDLLTDYTSFNQQLLSNKTFMIDAGHGGYDVGAISANDQYEKDITFVTANKLKNALTNLGANVHLTRSNDEFIRLGSRVSSANLLGPDAFISIHYNSFPESPSAAGIGSYYYHEDDQALADNIQEEIIQMTEARDRGAIDEDYQVLRHNKNSAILLELGFISNQEEADLLLTNTYQKKLVQGIVNGLVKHYGNGK